MTTTAAHIPPRTLVCGNFKFDRSCLNKRIYTVEAEVRPDGLWRYPTGLCCPHCGVEMWIQPPVTDSSPILSESQWAFMRAMGVTP